jgi:APA family basic amino acid/polyamine antiporter
VAGAMLQAVFPSVGGQLMAIAIMVSAFGCINGMLMSGARAYFAMARDGLFFRSVAKLTKHTHVPALAIVLQSVWTTVVALSGRYDQILNYVVSMDFLFFGLTGASLFILRSRDTQSSENAGYRAPGHPFTTGLFVLASWLVVINTIYKYPKNSLLGMSILVLGLPVYAFWAAKLKSGDVEI